MESALIIHPEGAIEVAEFDKEKSYDFISGAVGGWIQPVVLAYNDETGVEITGYCHEEGKIIGLTENPLATVICRLNKAIELYDWIAGPLVITCTDEDGETAGLNAELIEQIMVIAAA
jgi:imidazole glycerol phosphate synthase subunit HisF